MKRISIFELIFSPGDRNREIVNGDSPRRIRLDTKFPEDAGSLSVAVKAEQGIDLASVEPVDGVMQPGRRVNVVSDRQRILNMLNPTFLFEHRQNGFLIPRRYAKAFNDQSSQR